MNSKSTKSGGRDAGGYKKVLPPGCDEDIMDHEFYMGTGMKPVDPNAAFPAQVPEDPRWKNWPTKLGGK